MIYFIFFLCYFLILKNKFSVTSTFSLIIALSGLCAYVIDKDIDYTDIENYPLIIFTSFILFLIIDPIRKLDSNNLHELSKVDFNRRFINIIHILCFIALILSIYILFTSINAFSAAQGTVEDFKNDGEADTIIKSRLGSLVITYVRLVSPLSYLVLPIHFIYILKKEYVKSGLFLLYSTLLPIIGLFALSRSFLTQFIIIYFLFFILFRNQFSRKIKKIYYVLASLVIILVGGINYSIAEERFADTFYYENRISDKSLINDKSAYSLFDYFSQWIYNNNESLKTYEIEKNLSAQASLPLFRRFGLIDSKNFYEQRSKSLGAYSTSFIGLVSAFVFDFGFILTFLIFLINYKILNRKFSYYRRLKVTDLMFLSLYFAFFGMFFVGNIFSYEIFSTSIIYFIVINKTKIIYQ